MEQLFSKLFGQHYPEPHELKPRIQNPVQAAQLLTIFRAFMQKMMENQKSEEGKLNIITQAQQ